MSNTNDGNEGKQLHEESKQQQQLDSIKALLKQESIKQ